MSYLVQAKAELKYLFSETFNIQGEVKKASLRLAEEIKKIMAHAEELAHTQNGKKIAVMTGHGLNAIHLSCDALWLMALQRRGHQTMAIICNQALPSCEFNHLGNSSRLPKRGQLAFTRSANTKVCRDCTDSAVSVLSATKSPILNLQKYANQDDDFVYKLASEIPSDQIRSYYHGDICVGEHAFSSTLRTTLRGEIDLNNPQEVLIFRRHLASAIILSNRLNRLIDTEKPERFIGIHGIYLTHGTMVDICKARSIPAVIYGMPYRKDTLWLSHEESYHRSLLNVPPTYWDYALTNEQKNLIDTYLKSREVGGRDNVNYHPNPILERGSVARAIGLSSTKPVVSMFTNVIWDAQIHYPSNAFRDIFEWVYWTIDYFSSRPDIQLVVRVHPAESKGGFTTKQPLYPEILRKYPSLPPNVFIVPSESDVSSYTLAEMSVASLIYGTKMGLELAYRGIPVILAGESFSRGKGYTFDVSTPNEYKDLLDALPELSQKPEMREKAERYAYYYFFRKMIDFPLLGTDFTRSARDEDEKFYTFTNINDLAHGEDEALDIACDGIINGAEFHLQK
jgi:hypothetical protein